MIHIWHPLWGREWGEGLRQKLDAIRRRWVGRSERSGRPIFISFIKENWICAMPRRHAESNMNMLLTRNLPFNSDIRQWSHPLIIPLHYLWAKSNNRMRGQFECDVTRFYFVLILFVRMHGIIWRGGVQLKLDVQDQGVDKLRT